MFKQVERKPTQDKHPLNPKFIHTGSLHFRNLCQLGRVSKEDSNSCYFNQHSTLQAWKEINPQITHSDAKLLRYAGELALKIADLPLYLIIQIANFLYPSDASQKKQRSKPVEWLILFTIYKQLTPKTTSLEQEVLSKQYIQCLFEKANQKTRLSSNPATSLQNEKRMTEKDLLQAVIQESEHAVIVTAQRITHTLSKENSQQQLILVALFGSYAQKTWTLYHLLIALQEKYFTCKSNHPIKNEKYYNAYAETKKYTFFIEKYYSIWLEVLKKTAREKQSIEEKIVEDYPRYLSCANETLRDYAPQSAKRRWWK